MLPATSSRLVRAALPYTARRTLTYTSEVDWRPPHAFSLIDPLIDHKEASDLDSW